MGSSEAPVRVGILGAANIAQKQCRAINMTDKLTVAAVASRDVSKAQAMIDKWQLKDAKAYASYDELLADPSIDAVYIPLPSALHIKYVPTAASKGKHILLEKPISVTAEEAEALAQACREANVQLMDGTMWVHSPRAEDMRAVIQGGGLGQLRDIHSVFTFNSSPEFLAKDIRLKPDCDPLGALGDLGWYCIRAMLWALDWQAPASVQAHAGATFNGEGVVTHCGATLVFPGGVRGHFECGFDAALTQWLMVQGTEGTIRVDDFVITAQNVGQCTYKLSYNHGLQEYDTRESTAVDEKVVMLPQPQEVLMWERFAECVRRIKQGGQPDEHWPRIAVLTQKVVNAVLDSLRQGCKEVRFSA